MTQFDVPASTQTSIEGVNNAGTTVGWFNDAAGHQHGFIHTSMGQITSIDNPKGDQGTMLNDISNNGIIVGTFAATDNGGVHVHPFKLNADGTMTDVNQVGNGGSAEGINSAGTVVGVGSIFGCCNVSWMTTADGTSTQVNDPTVPCPGCERPALGINDAGIIVGGPLYSRSTDNKFTYFTIPGIPNAGASAFGVNNQNEIVGGFVITNNGPSTGFMKSGAQFFTFSFPSADSTQLNDINDTDFLVGDFTDSTGKVHGFTAQK